MNYVHVRKNKIISSGECHLLNEDALNIPVSDEIAQNWKNYKFIAPDKIVLKTKTEIEAETAEAERQARIAEIRAELIELDNKTIRPLRAGETEKLAELEAQAEPLRIELREFENSIEI